MQSSALTRHFSFSHIEDSFENVSKNFNDFIEVVTLGYGKISIKKISAIHEKKISLNLRYKKISNEFHVSFYIYIKICFT